MRRRSPEYRGIYTIQLRCSPLRPSIGTAPYDLRLARIRFQCWGCLLAEGRFARPLHGKPVKQLPIELVGAAVVYATLNRDAGKHLDAFELHCLQPVSVET